MQHSQITVDGGRFAYLDAGERDAPVVLCLHGFPDHPPSFIPLMDRLAAAGLRAIAPWMRGYHPSVATGPFHFERLADDLSQLAR
ncbi:MAG: alpha/beta hydrolase, partial [Myxococcota bacterium]